MSEQNSNAVHVNSEIGALRSVIVHGPDDGISRISPKRAEELLFDDIVHLPLMQREHAIFTKVLKTFIPADDVLDTLDLIKQSLESDASKRSDLIAQVLEYEEQPLSYLAMFIDMDNETLAKVLITGYHEESDHIYFDPIPNFIFTRDIAVVVNNHVIITKAAKEARYRENILTRYIFNTHPRFKHLATENRIININNIDAFPRSKKGESVSIEGGDLMILNEDYLMIGCSERTTAHAFDSIKEYLFEQGVISNLVKVNIPSDRSFMHLDTLCTMIDKDVFACFKPIIHDGMSSNVEVHTTDKNHRTYGSVKDFLLEEINKDFRFVFSGNGESPYQEREQWTDGCNLVAIKPGVAITYDRNLKTDIAFESQGFNILTAEELFNRASIDQSFAGELQHTIITIPSAELSRARGGSHCMTCPILRSDS